MVQPAYTASVDLALAVAVVCKASHEYSNALISNLTCEILKSQQLEMLAFIGLNV